MEDYKNESIDILNAIGWPVPKRDNGMVSCPMHTDKTPSMSINLNKALYHCFSCGAHGSLFSKYREVYGKPYKINQSKMMVSSFSIFKQKTREEIEEDLIETPIPHFVVTEHPETCMVFFEWLKYRGISLDVAGLAGLKYGSADIHVIKSESTEELKYTINSRVMIPIIEKGHLLSVEFRYPFLKTSPKTYKNGTPIKKCLYPKGSSTNTLYLIDHLDKNTDLYVLEGIMDCLAFRSLTGIKNSTALMGASITKRQLLLLTKFCRKVIYVYNNDKAGLGSLKTMREAFDGKFSMKLYSLKPLEGCDDVGDMAQAGNLQKDKIDAWLKTAKLEV